MALFEKNILAWIIGLSLVILAISQGGYSFITVDTLYKIEISKMMLNGKMIYKDLFEVNHPMPTYIIWVAVYVASKIAWLSDVVATKAWLSFLCLLSVILTHKVMSLTDEYKDHYFRFIFIIALFYVTFLVPMHYAQFSQLGQKSHLFFILFLPYLHSFLLTDQQRKQHPYLMLTVGIMAGIGLCVKIFFFAVAFILEGARMLNKKSFYSLFRIENIAIASVAIVFLLSIIIFTPEYIRDVIPMARFGYVGYSITGNYDWLVFLLSISPCFILVLVFVSIKPALPKYSHLLQVAIAASLVSILIQTSKWDHAALPTFSLMMLFVAMVAADIIRKLVADFPRDKSQKFTRSYLSGIFFLSLTLIYINQSLTHNITHYSANKSKIYAANKVHYFMDLSDEYAHRGGLYFLNESFTPALQGWIYGNSSLQSYFYSAYMIDGLHRYREVNQYQKSPQWIKDNLEPVEMKVRDKMVADLNKQKPALIIVQAGVRVMDKDKEKRHFRVNDVDYIQYLKKNARFGKIWQQYQFKEIVEYSEEKEGDLNYQSLPVFLVYSRKDL